MKSFRSVFSILGVIGLGACGQGSESSGEPSDGACEGASCNCAAPLVDCGGTCVDRLSDGANCGACANVCGSGLVCSQGTCAASCGATETQCGRSCVDVLSHAAHCGTCDVACGAGSVCAAGVCQTVSTGTGGTSSGGGSSAGGATGGGMSTGGVGTGGIGGSTSGGNGGGGTGGSGPLGPCEPYEWPSYEPHLDYELPGSDIDPSSLSIYPGCSAGETAGTMSDGWWSITWGNNLNPQVTEQQMARVLAGLNEDMGYVRDVMGWPPDPMPQAGYFSSVYVYGSGLCTDDADNQAQGGWQSNIGPYPMVLLSWAPIVNYDRGGITHEAIHAMVKGMPGGNNKAHWFNEGGNTWIQMQLGAEKDGTYGVGFLDGAPFVAPHQPIESYSGWLLDGSFGGPDAEGVGQPDCNWRRYLGGTQYNSILSHFLALHVSEGANAWLWAQENPRNILETLEAGLGEEQTRHLVMEYRARTALVDFGPWRDSIINQGINYTWGDNLNRECGSGENPPDYLSTAYAPTTTEGSTIIPDDYTLPGWSGSNQIPLNVSGDTVRLNFNPEGQNMRIQIAYWAEDGTAVYSQPAESGEVCLRLDEAPKNDVVIAVVSNTDYIYEGDETRFARFDYSIDMVEGATSTADRMTRWFLND